MKSWRQIGLIILSLSVLSATEIDFRKLKIVTDLNNEKYARNGPCIAGDHDIIKLSLVLSARVEKLFSEIYITSENGLIMAGDTVQTDRIKKWEDFASKKPLIRWYLILPTRLDTVYRNTPEMRTQWAQVIYEEIPIAEWNDQWTVNVADLNVKQQLFPGTAWFKAEIAFRGQFAATPGIENRYRVASGDYGGLSPKVFRLSVKSKTGNRFLDNLLIFRNLPYIANSNSWNGYWSDHQTKQWIGGDLMTFTYFAMELAGRSSLSYFGKLPMPPSNAFEATEYFELESHYRGGFFLMNRTEPIVIDQINFGLGDFVANRYQFAILARDRNPDEANREMPNRRLDEADLVLMNRGGALEMIPLREALGDTLTLVRWRKRW